MFRFNMNRLLNRKKTDESLANIDTRSQTSTPSLPSPGLKKSATSRWKKSGRQTKEQPEPKPELDLSGALPSNDDFRTSLLMANLSQRFSMLRDQDNPDSIVGKASDDSVLEPRRRSRKLDFGFGASGLTDIDEVMSINSSIRPPFANEKHQSFRSDDGYMSESDGPHSGGMMARSRPGEGNTMFGGRQKVYMIPKNGAASTKSLGKFLYDDDVGMSAFQKHRQRERELQAARDPEMPEDPSFDFGLDQAEGGDEDERSGLHDSARDFTNSPSMSAYDKKRSTSSTARSDARSSTAATSITSQTATSTSAQMQAPAMTTTAPSPVIPQGRTSLDKTNPKSRRLYEQGLDQHMHDQQYSALSRLNSIQRQRTFTNGKSSPPFLHAAKSTGNLNERPPQHVYSSKSSSPPVPPLVTFGLLSKSGQSPVASGPNSPLSPTIDESCVLKQALEPADRGKATAMGAFNKPKNAFDEQQYMERQMQLQRSASSAVPRQPAASAFQQRMDRMEQGERERSMSNPTNRSRSTSASKQHESSKAFNAFHNAASSNQSVQGASQPGETSSYPDTHRTFFGNISGSDSEDEEEEQQRTASPYGQQENGIGQQYPKWQPTVLPSVSEHPALRNNNARPALLEEEAEEDQEATPQHDERLDFGLPARQEAVAQPMDNGKELDSPTLGPNSEGLGSMMQHLRNQSNASSNYAQDETSPPDGPLPDLPTMADLKNYEPVRQSLPKTNDTESYIDSSNTNSNPWDLETDSVYYNNNSTSITRDSVVDDNTRAGNVSSRAPSRTAMPNEEQSEPFPDSEAPSWQAELTRQHTRNISTATQQERAAFDNELAARRRAIQENVKSMVDADQSRNTSPAPTAGGAFKAFNMLRSKSSRDSMDTRKDVPPKAMKMMGLGNGQISASTSNLHSQYDGGKSFEINRSRGNSATRAPLLSRMLQQSDQDAKRERVGSRARGDSEASRIGRPIGRSPASSEAGRGRGRSNSELGNGNRSRSTTGPYRDDLERAMAQGTGTSAFGVPELSPMLTKELTPGPSPDISNKSSFETKGRSRSGSRTGAMAMANYFEAKTLQANQPPQQVRPPVVGPSPAAMASNSFLARGSPYMQAPTPPMSGPNTPVASSPTPPQMPPGPTLRQAPLRKRTINKHDISEPVALLSATSNVDTVDLPVGASLKNGMGTPPPVPPINPRRRATRKLFGKSRNEAEEQTNVNGDVSQSASRSGTPDLWGSSGPGPRARNISNPPRPYESSPALQQYGFEQSGPPTRQFSNSKSPPMRPYGHEQSMVGSPEDPERAHMEGGFI
ncbi:hypothetical protein Q7P37_003404 [Cladosporium fusiforme]